MSKEKILFVDDEPNILDAFRRHLYNRFIVHTAQNAKDALEIIRKEGPFAVVVSDLSMPVMSGVEFLARVKDIAPTTVRMMLTGHADVTAASEAVNEGNIFRFLTKPCNINLLIKSLEAGIEQYALITAENEILEKTLKGVVQVLSEMLGLVSNEVMGRSARVKETASSLAVEMKIEKPWEVVTAAMLSQIGCIVLPETLLLKINRNEPLDEIEERMAREHPLTAARLIMNIPRMEGVARIITYQNKDFDGGGYPEGDPTGKEIPIGSRILRVALDYDTFLNDFDDPVAALKEMRANQRAYDPDALTALETLITVGGTVSKPVHMEVKLSELTDRMLLDEDLYTLKGQLLLKKGLEINRPMIERLINFSLTHGIREPLAVMLRQ